MSYSPRCNTDEIRRMAAEKFEGASRFLDQSISKTWSNLPGQPESEISRAAASTVQPARRKWRAKGRRKASMVHGTVEAISSLGIIVLFRHGAYSRAA